jgi:hypothetical protein
LCSTSSKGSGASECVSANQPLLSREHGELFMQALNVQLAHFEPCKCDWYTIQDDDNWFEPASITAELPDLLRSKSIDLWYAHTLFMWNAPDQFHAERPHHSGKIFRACPGDRFPLNRIIHATERVHDQAVMAGRIATMKTPLLDYGCYSPEERRRVYDTYVEAGKVDPFTASLTAPARLAKFPEDAIRAGLAHRTDWIDLWSGKKP